MRSHSSLEDFMVIVALRHIVAEICIEAFFDKFANNFNKSVLLGEIRVGDYFKKIQHKELDEVYYNCRVTAVVDVKDSNGISNGHQFIYIKYSDYKTDIDDLEIDLSTMDDDELERYLEENNIELVDDEYIDLDDMDDLDFTTIDFMESGIDDTVGLNTEYHNFFK